MALISDQKSAPDLLPVFFFCEVTMTLTLEHEILIGATEGLGQSGRNSLNVFLRHQGRENQRAGLQLLPLACRHELPQ